MFVNKVDFLNGKSENIVLKRLVIQDVIVFISPVYFGDNC